MLSGIEFMILEDLASILTLAITSAAYREDCRKLCSNVTSASDLDEGFVERGKFRVFELSIIEAEEIVHDDVSGQRWKGI